MSSQAAMSLMSVTEFALWAVLGFLFWKKRLQCRFPAMGAYLTLRIASMPVLMLLFYGQSQHWFNDYCFAIYFFVYWSVYIASAVILYFVCMEILRSALSSYSGLMRFGLVAFRWAALVSVLMTLSMISYSHKGVMVISEIANALMRPVSVVQLCILAFLCFSMNALRLSVRDLSFGFALGFGLLSANDFTNSFFVSALTSLTAPAQFLYESLILATLCIWLIYCALPEAVRLSVVTPVNTTIYRWNEIASALGHKGTQVVAPQPAGSFFLTDVEEVVDKVFNRSLKSSESKS